MPAPRSPARLAIDAILADGNWHDLEELVAAAMPLIPPGRAYRRAENNRRRHSTAPERTRNTRDDAIRIGARDIARDLITQAARNGAIERDGNRYRTTP